jgi:CHAT domain-containing protein/tetratricopeptide (TPR) repeat protein
MKFYTAFRIYISLFCLIIFLGISYPVLSQRLDTLEANSQFNKGLALINLSYYDSAALHFEKAADIYKIHKSVKSYFLARNKSIDCYWQTYKLKKAHDLAKLVLKEAGEGNLKDTLGEVQTLNTLAYVHLELGNYELSIQTFEKVLAKRTAATDSLSATTYLGFAEVNFLLDKYKPALEYYNKALEISKKNWEEEHELTAMAYLKLSNFYRNQGNFGIALDNANKAEQIFKKRYNNQQHLRLADSYLNLANVYRDKRSFDKALEYYQEAEILYGKFLRAMHPSPAFCKIGMADIYRESAKIDRTQYEKSQQLYMTAVEIFQQAVGDYHPGVILAYLGIGNLYLLRENQDLALDFYTKVIDINYDLRGENTKTSSAAYNNMGSIYYFNGKYEIARQNFKKALEIDLTLYGTKHPNVANAYYNIGKVYEEQGKFETALEFFQLAICSSISDFHEENIYTNPKLQNYYDENDLFYYLRFKAQTLQRGFEQQGISNLKGLSIAMQTYLLCDQLIETMRRSHTSEHDKIELGKEAHKLYEAAVTAAFHLYQGVNQYNILDLDTKKDLPSLKREYLDYLYYFSEKNKGAVLSAALADAKAKSFAGIPDSLLNKEVEIRQKIAEYKNELATKPDSLTEIYFKEKLFYARRQYEALIESFEKQYPKYYELKYDLRIVSTQNLQSVLDDETAVISYFSMTGRLYVMTLTKKGLQVSEVEKDSDFDRQIITIRNTILFKLKKAFAVTSNKMYRQLFPQPLPKEIKKLVVIPDGNIAMIPFETLVTQKVTGDEEYSQLPFLIKNYEISYAFSANLFYQTHHNQADTITKAPNSWIGMAPVFAQKTGGNLSAAAERTLRSMDNAASENNNESSVASLSKIMRGGHITEIPETETEVQAIQKLFAQNNFQADALVHDQVDEAYIKKGALEKARYVHIATHGFVNAESPDFSGILLAQNPSTVEDGVLYSGEIYNLKFNSDLVVLSACETGLGKISRGEGVIGLSRALLYAGTQSLVVSLWKVSDASTSMLMIDFYDALLHHTAHDKSEALQRSKLKMIEQNTFSAPYFWSPFILIGQ